MNRVSTKQAAAELNMGVVTLQKLLQLGELPIGYAIKKEKSKRYAYFVYRGLLDAEKNRLGITERREG